MKRGFTLLELSICLTILAIVVPSAFLLGRSIQQGQLEAAAQAEAAASMRSVSEELRRDLRTMGWPEDAELRLEGAGECKAVEYLLTSEHLLVRRGGEGCGPERAVAAGVRSIARESGGVRVVFFKRLSPARERTDSFFMGFGE